MAAFDAEIVDALRPVEHIVTFEPEIIEGVHPFAAGVEMTDFAFEPTLPDLHIPGTHARTLKTGTKRDAVLIQPPRLVGDNRAAPVELGNSAPIFAMANTRQ